MARTTMHKKDRKLVSRPVEKTIAAIGHGVIFTMSLLLPIELADPEVRAESSEQRKGREAGERCFAGRTDGLRPPNDAEEPLVAMTCRQQ